MQKHYFTLVIIALFSCLDQFAINIYTPSLPAIATYFGVSLNLVQWSITIYAAGLSISMLIYGPLSEVFGRRSTLLYGFCLMLIGSLICTLAHDMTTLIIGRLVQGLGAGVTPVLWRAIMRDLFSGRALAKYLSYLTPIDVGILATAPLLGGYFQHYLSWRASFVFLLAYVLICITLTLYLYTETSQHHGAERLKLNFVTTAYRQIISHPVFISYACCLFLSFGAYFCWSIIGPIVTIHLLHISTIQFGWINSIALASMSLLASIINARLVQRYDGNIIIYFGFSLIMLAGLILLINEFFFQLNIECVVLAALLLYCGDVFIWINANAGVMTPFGYIAGFAATLSSFIQFAGGTLIGALLTYMPDHSAMPLALAWIVIALIGILTSQLMRKVTKQS